MSLWNRLKVASVMGAIFLLVTGISDAFFHWEYLSDLLFHSVVFHIVMIGFLLIIAPYFVKIFGLKIGSQTSVDKDA